MRLIFARHGKTHFNEINLTQGWCDSPLSKTGTKQAEDMRGQLKEIPLTKAYCSPLGRAVQTAKILLKDRKVPMIYDERLKEIHFGLMEGISGEIVQSLRIESPNWLNDLQLNYSSYEGEDLQDVIQRHQNFLNDIREQNQEEDTILIVGHGCSLYGLIKSILPKDQPFDFLQNVEAVIIDEKAGYYELEKRLTPHC